MQLGMGKMKKTVGVVPVDVEVTGAVHHRRGSKISYPGLPTAPLGIRGSTAQSTCR